MPELPEVETTARELERRVRGRKVVAVALSGARLRLARAVDAVGVRRAALGRQITRVWRRAKYLVIELEEHALLVHLGMSGRLLVQPASSERPPHTHLVLALSGRPEEEVRFIDPRRFGLVRPYELRELGASEELRELGPEPLGDALSGEGFWEALRATRGASIKAVLLDQRQLAGVGNIYACEALFLAGVHPALEARRLSRSRAEGLLEAVRVVLRRGLENRGTTLRDYAAPEGKGANQQALEVFAREGLACPRCGRPVRRMIQAGRSTYFCAGCQRRAIRGPVA